MAKNFIQRGETLTVVAPLVGGLASGQGLLVGALFGVSQYDAPAGASAELGVVGTWTLPKAAAIVFAVGAVYWDVDAGNMTSVASTNFPIGVADGRGRSQRYHGCRAAGRRRDGRGGLTAANRTRPPIRRAATATARS